MNALDEDVEFFLKEVDEFPRRKGLFERCGNFGIFGPGILGDREAGIGSDVDKAALSTLDNCCGRPVLSCTSSSQKSLDLSLSIDDLGVAFPLPLKPALSVPGSSVGIFRGLRVVPPA